MKIIVEVSCVFYLFYCRRFARCGNDLMKDVVCDFGKALVISFVVLILKYFTESAVLMSFQYMHTQFISLLCVSQSAVVTSLKVTPNWSNRWLQRSNKNKEIKTLDYTMKQIQKG